MFHYQPLYTSDLGTPESSAASEPDRVQPELGDVDVSLDVYVRRLLAVTSVEEATIRTGSQCGWHSLMNDSTNACSSTLARLPSSSGHRVYPTDSHSCRFCSNPAIVRNLRANLSPVWSLLFPLSVLLARGSCLFALGFGLRRGLVRTGLAPGRVVLSGILPWRIEEHGERAGSRGFPGRLEAKFHLHVFPVADDHEVHVAADEGAFHQGRRLHGLEVDQVADKEAVQAGVVLPEPLQ